MSDDIQKGREQRAVWLDRGIFFFLIVFAAALPHSIRGAQRAWRIAALLWFGRMAVDRKRPFEQPLTAPLLAYVSLSAISTALTTDPILSWDRMKIVCLVLLGVVVAQNVKRLSQVRVLVVVLLLSGIGAAGFTAWQYTFGVGVRVAHLAGNVPLYAEGLRPDDIITSINEHSVHFPPQVQKVVDQAQPMDRLPVHVLRGYPFQKFVIVATPQEFAQSGLGTETLPLVRGKPFRAQGTLGHYVVFAEMLMQIACLAWGLGLCVSRKRGALLLVCVVSFLSVTAALFFTETRAALGGLALGCFAALILNVGRRTRIWAACVLVIVVAVTAYWVQHTRRLGLLDRGDTGMQFRVLMWEDGLRLVKEHPWFGVGMETVRVHWQEWHIRGFEIYHVQSHFHSTPLQIAVERGLPTLAAWLWFVVAYLIFLVKLIPRARAQSLFAAGVVSGVLAGFIASLLTSIVHYNLGEEPLVMILFFYFGLAVAIDHLVGVPESQRVDC